MSCRSTTAISQNSHVCGSRHQSSDLTSSFELAAPSTGSRIRGPADIDCYNAGSRASLAHYGASTKSVELLGEILQQAKCCN